MYLYTFRKNICVLLEIPERKEAEVCISERLDTFADFYKYKHTYIYLNMYINMLTQTRTHIFLCFWKFPKGKNQNGIKMTQ